MIRSAGSLNPEEIQRWNDATLPAGMPELTKIARDEGHEFLVRFETEWSSGVLFDGPGECLFFASIGDRLVGISGICRDPYQLAPDVGRLRHVYVDPAIRSQGIAARLVQACLACTGSHFRVIRLKTVNPVAARIYERLGFHAVTMDGEPMTHCLSTKAAAPGR